MVVSRAQLHRNEDEWVSEVDDQLSADLLHPENLAHNMGSSENPLGVQIPCSHQLTNHEYLDE